MGSVSGSGGRVTSILRPGEAEKMESLAENLGFSFEDVEYIGSSVDESNIDDMRRFLEDTLTLVDLAEEPEIDLEAAEKSRSLVEYDDVDDEEDEEVDEDD